LIFYLWTVRENDKNFFEIKRKKLTQN